MAMIGPTASAEHIEVPELRSQSTEVTAEGHWITLIQLLYLVQFCVAFG